MNLRAWFKDEATAVKLYLALITIYEENLKIPNHLRVSFIPKTGRHEFLSAYEKKGYVSRVLVTHCIGTTPIAQFYATALLAMEALGGFVEVSIDGTDFRSLAISDASREETISLDTQEKLKALGINVVVY